MRRPPKCDRYGELVTQKPAIYGSAGMRGEGEGGGWWVVGGLSLNETPRQETSQAELVGCCGLEEGKVPIAHACLVVLATAWCVWGVGGV